MKLAITGADQPMGALLCQRLAAHHEVIPVGAAVDPGEDGVDAASYCHANLNLPPAAAAAIRGTDMIVHAQPHDPAPASGTGAEGELLERISRGTYVLLQAAMAAHVGRLILISQMRLFQDIPEQYIVTETWQPRPRPEAASLAPFMAELVCREIARTGRIEVVNLRMGTLGAADGTSGDDAVAAVQRALVLEMSEGYHWQEQHVVSGGRFLPQGA
ncbi:MAG: NAD-dependent epimerase/dehydratase family protein [bacterium]|nr:NAD-dependent epimerase/dehydratase family protein [bacterium]